MNKDPEKVGRYQVLERVGRGGMGVLYRGVDPVLDREVAIKLMLADFSEDAEQMRPRFYREARSAAKLQHRNIVTIFEFAEEGNTPYIVMEFLRGAPLASRMETAPPLTLDDKLDIVAQLCSGLSYAHEQGVVHRDVKPANVFLLEDGTVKLLDFGIAKVTTSNLTRQGDVLGSASYMSPEQVMGSESVDGRADIFSTGVMLYEMLAGRKPFEGEAATAIVMKILNEDPPPIETFVSGVPQQLVAVLTKALQRDPANRFQTAAELGRELQVIRKGLQSGAIKASIEQTQVASTQFLKGLHKEMEQSRGAGVRVAETQVAATAAAVAAAAPARKWMVPAGIVSVVAVIVGALMIGRPGTTSSANPAPTVAAAENTATLASPPPGAAAPVPAAAAPANAATPATAAAVTPQSTSVLVSSEPPGATIFLDGARMKNETPSAIDVKGGGPHRLRLIKADFLPIDTRVSETELKSGAVKYTLKAAVVPTIPVSLTGTYPFEVLDGTKQLSPPGESHELSVAAGKQLRLVAVEYFLNQTYSVKGTPGEKLEAQAPALGRLSVRSNKFEACVVKVDGRELVEKGEKRTPPIANMPIASGSHRVDLACPNGQNPLPWQGDITAGTRATPVTFQ